jgi:hypothetical protein
MKKTILIVSTFFLIILLVYEFKDSIDFINNKNKKKEWTQNQIDEFKNKSMNELYSLNSAFKNYPDFVHEYCNCVVDTLLQHYTYDEVWKMENLPLNERINKFQPILKKCSDKFLLRIAPYKKEIKREQNISTCIERFIKHKNDSSLARSYCTCMIEYIENKYGDLDKINLDSILVLEKIKIQDCYKNAN